MKEKKGFGYISALLLSLLAALIICAGILLLSGYDPLTAYGALIGGAFSNARHIGDMIEYAMVLCLCGLACDIASRVGIFNVGGEGQLLLGAVFSAQIGIWLCDLPPVAAILLAALGAMVIGGFYAWIPGVLKVRLNVNEVITTIMLNTIAASLCQFLAKGPWKNPDKNIIAGTTNLPKELWLTKLVPGSNLTTAIFSAIIVTFLTWYILQKTFKGYEMRITGNNRRFAHFSGLKTERMIIRTMVVSGMLCGLVGMLRVYGSVHLYKSSVSNDYYFEGLMVAMIAQFETIPTVIISFLFAILKIGAQGMEADAGVPNQIYLIIQTIVIFCMVAEKGIRAEISSKAQDRRARLAAKKRLEGSSHES